MVTLILFVLIFGVVVVSHEFGHFLLAKANGIHVIEFSVGMGPNLFSFQKGDTKYSLKLLPIGGACMFEGEDGLNEKEDGEDHSGSFLNANVWARISTVLAGPVWIVVNVVGKTYETTKDYGWQNVLVNMLNITLMLTVNLGILNLLPVPALDGGRLVFLLWEAITHRPVPPEKEGIVHFIGLMFFMVLMVFLLFNDLVNIFG